METLQLRDRDEEKRSLTRVLRAVLILAIGLAGVMLLALSSATRNSQFFTAYYLSLFWTAVGLGVVILGLLAELLRRLINRLRRGLFGSRLMARMALVFIALAVAPAALIFFVSVQFIERSVESWFDLPVERALDSGLSLARVSLDSRLQALMRDARAQAFSLEEGSPAAIGAQLERVRARLGAAEVQLLSGSGRLLASASEAVMGLAPQSPGAAILRQARSQGQWGAIEGSDGGYRLRVLVPWSPQGNTLEQHWLQAVAPVPADLGGLAEAAQQGWRDYQELSLARATLKRLFRATLIIVFLLTVFGAVAAAFLLAGWLVGPLAELAHATRVLASGQFIEVRPYAARDELGVLMQSFNNMSRGLHEAQQIIGENQAALQVVNLRLQSILTHIDAAVLVLDGQMRLESANAQLERLGGHSLQGCKGWPLLQLPGLGDLARSIQQAFAEQPADEPSGWQRQWTLRDGAVTLLARGASLGPERSGFVVVLDDISSVVSGERALAWAEVAQRLAHEIKNPLTPIQLSAERLQRKLQPQLSGAQADLVERTASTIVQQVSALKALVDQLRDYARLASTQLEALQINDLVREVVGLYQQEVVAQLDPEAGQIAADRLQLRQVLHNLVKNALEAHSARADGAGPEGTGAQRRGAQGGGAQGGADEGGASEGGADEGGADGDGAGFAPVIVSTQSLKRADGRAGVRLRVRDHGPGFSQDMLARVFEPYVTTKASGSGLGLAIVRKIVEEHGARIEVSNWTDASGRPAGAQVSIVFPTDDRQRIS